MLNKRIKFKILFGVIAAIFVFTVSMPQSRSIIFSSPAMAFYSNGNNDDGDDGQRSDRTPGQRPTIIVKGPFTATDLNNLTESSKGGKLKDGTKVVFSGRSSTDANIGIDIGKHSRKLALQIMNALHAIDMKFPGRDRRSRIDRAKARLKYLKARQARALKKLKGILKFAKETSPPAIKANSILTTLDKAVVIETEALQKAIKSKK